MLWRVGVVGQEAGVPLGRRQHALLQRHLVVIAHDAIAVHEAQVCAVSRDAQLAAQLLFKRLRGARIQHFDAHDLVGQHVAHRQLSQAQASRLNLRVRWLLKKRQFHRRLSLETAAFARSSLCRTLEPIGRPESAQFERPSAETGLNKDSGPLRTSRGFPLFDFRLFVLRKMRCGFGLRKQRCHLFLAFEIRERGARRCGGTRAEKAENRSLPFVAFSSLCETQRYPQREREREREERSSTIPLQASSPRYRQAKHRQSV
eukprot:scaffold3719_cov247-Pinguiococcus_pyrenoidosus.AAC.9